MRQLVHILKLILLLSTVFLISGCDIYTPLSFFDDDETESNYPPYSGNSPYISEFELTPQNAYTNTDLQAQQIVYDYDTPAEELSYSYQWFVNDVLVPNQTTDSLSSSYFIKSDTVSVSLTVSDGINSTTSNYSTIIQDSPVEISLLNKVTSINYTDTLDLDISLSDPDTNDLSDTISYEILYGPNGMSVDNTGHISWTPGNPMFKPSTTFNWGLKVSSNGSESFLHDSIILKDSNRKPPLTRSTLAVSGNPYATFTGDLNNDGITEILTTDNNSNVHTLVYKSNNYIQDWVSSFALADDGQKVTALNAVDVNADNKMEIFVGTSSVGYPTTDVSLIKLDGITRLETTRITLNAEKISALAIADVNNDSTNDLILLVHETDSYDTKHIEVRSSTDLSLIWQSSSLALGNDLAVKNVDNDNYIEMITSQGYIFAYNGTDFTNQWAYNEGFGTPMIVGDIDNNGVAEIIGYSSSSINVVSAISKTQIASLPIYSVQALTISNIDGDAEPELIASYYSQFYVYSYDTLTSTFNQDYATNLAYGMSNIFIDDLDNDSVAEIAISTGAKQAGSFSVLGLSPDFSVEWQNAQDTFYAGTFHGGNYYTLAPDNNKLVYITNKSDDNSADPKLLALNPLTGDVTLSNDISLLENTHNLIAVDYDNDGVDEFITNRSSSYQYSTQNAYNFLDNIEEWTSPQMTATIVSTDVGDMNNDGSPDIISLNDPFTSTLGSVSIYVYDPLNSTLIWSHVLEKYEVPYDIYARDFDNDGTLEILTTTSYGITIYKKSGSSYVVDQTLNTNTSNSTTNITIKDVEIGDINNDGTLEIIALARDNYYSGNTTVKVFDALLNEKSSSVVGETAREITLENFTSGNNNLLISYSTNIYSTNSEFKLIDPYTGNEIFTIADIPGVIQRDSVNYVDINNDGIAEISYATNTSINITR